MQSGVVVFPSKLIQLNNASGIWGLAPSKNRGKPITKPSMDGLISPDFSVIYFLSRVRQKTPMVNTRIFMVMTIMEE